MSHTYRDLRAAIDREIEAEDFENLAKQARQDAISEVGKALRAVREYRGISLRECARQAKISAPFLSDIERGRRSMSDGTCEMLLGVLMTVKQL